MAYYGPAFPFGAPPQPATPEPKGGGGSTPLILGGVLIFLLVVAAAYYYWKNYYSAPAPAPETETVTTTATVSSPGPAPSPPPPPPMTPGAPSSSPQASAPSPASTITQVAKSFIGPYTGVTYQGTDIGAFSYTDYDSASAACLSTPNCIGFIISNSGTVLKSSFGTTAYSLAGSQAYIKPGLVLPGAAGAFQASVNGHYIGSEIGNYIVPAGGAAAEDVCAANCMSIVECKAFEVDSTSNCVMKRDLKLPLLDGANSSKVYKAQGYNPVIPPDPPGAIALLPADGITISSSDSANFSATTQPAISGGPCRFTMTWWMNVTAAASGWRSIFHNINELNWPNGMNEAGNCPYIGIGGSSEVNFPNKLLVTMRDAARTPGARRWLPGVVVDFGQWTHWALVVNNDTMTLYKNGSTAATYAIPAADNTVFQFADVNNFTWNAESQYWPTSANNQIKLKGAFWWNTNLSSTQIRALAQKS